jgi:hypothetical protein
MAENPRAVRRSSHGRARSMPLRACAWLLAMVALAGAMYAQSGGMNPPGPEAQYLELVDLVEDPAKQLELLDAFVIQFPKYPGMGAIYAQTQEVCIQLQLWDRALALGDKLLAIDASDTQAIRLNVTAADGKKDTALAAKLRERLQQLEQPAPETVAVTATIRLPWVDEDPTDDNVAAVDFSALPKQQRLRAEATLFNRALEEKEIKKKIKLLSVFAREFSTSTHVPEVRYLFFASYRDSDQHDKALATGEAILERDRTREDVLFYVAQRYFLAKREPAKTIAYLELVRNLLTTAPKPQQLTDEQWEAQKKVMTLHSHWIPGAIRIAQEQWADADQSLRAALPLSAPASELRARILTNLAWANYKLRRIPDALAFYRDCAAIGGPMQQAAEQSIVSIRSEYGLQ